MSLSISRSFVVFLSILTGILLGWAALVSIPAQCAQVAMVWSCLPYGMAAISLGAPIGFISGFLLVSFYLRRLIKGDPSKIKSGAQVLFGFIGSIIGVFVAFGLFLLSVIWDFSRNFLIDFILGDLAPVSWFLIIGLFALLG